MNVFRKILVSLGGVAALAVLFTLAAPRAVQAVAAALVQVTNTTANPAITQETRHQASQLVSMGVGFNGYGDTFAKNYMYQVLPSGGTGGAYKVPAGQNLVITNVTINPDPSYSTSNIEVMLVRDGGGSYAFWLLSPSSSTELHPTSTVIGGGFTPMISVRARDGKGFNVGVMVQGYLTTN
jgi:hypothetical protein